MKPNGIISAQQIHDWCWFGFGNIKPVEWSFSKISLFIPAVSVVSLSGSSGWNFKKGPRPTLKMQHDCSWCEELNAVGEGWEIKTCPGCYYGLVFNKNGTDFRLKYSISYSKCVCLPHYNKQMKCIEISAAMTTSVLNPLKMWKPFMRKWH